MLPTRLAQETMKEAKGMYMDLKTFVLPQELEIFEAPLEIPKADFPVGVIMEISPMVAGKWLAAYNKRNRPLRGTTATALGRDISNGDFILNGETLKYSRPLRHHEVRDGDGEWIPAGSIIQLDGQHRLEGCEEGGVAIRTGVYFGLEPDCQHTVDLTTKRTLGDAFRLRGEKNSNMLATSVRGALLMTQGDHYFQASKKPTQSEQMHFLEAHPELRRSAEIAQRVFNENPDTRPSVTGIAHWMFTAIDENEAAWFMERLGDGAHMAKSHPVKVLERKLRSDKAAVRRTGDKAVPQWMVLCYYINCWNKFREWGDRPEGQEYPTFFPITNNQREKKDFPTPQ